MNQVNEGTQREIQTGVVLGQKYAYATISLILGLSCFIGLAGMEKAILAIVFGCLALRSTPPPVLRDRRVWAKTGLALGSIIVVLVPTLIILNFDRLRLAIETLQKLSHGR